ncbi:hypothetical protein BO71DRAFT_454076 [Aspergillus ellipticus CBS 707.79]|uniref:UbiA prenyltransferase n=1 Tax=Aspergillus ellipticus CBS 707.79 TaxID=1448320 RepID=A0A319D1M7_9EURO|nr:hypothetical protein BO71DRAFT_454076 [Aspergillus ellipticus CBS 707.79]
MSLTPPPPKFHLRSLPALFWHFTESNLPTFVLPNTAFGLLSALASPSLTTSPHPSPPPLPLPLFSLLPQSILEDHHNKPWRPLPTNRITPTQTRRLLLVAIPLFLAQNYWLGVWHETALIFVLTWVYNDLGGGDEICRDGVIALAYGLFNCASLRIMASGGGGVEDVYLTETGYLWIGIISGVILTTMQVQDLKDQVGDRTRGRQTIPIVLGERCSRVMVAGFVGLWTVVCVWYWGVRGWCVVGLGGMGGWVVLQVLFGRDDAVAWRLWCGWLVGLYCLPCCWCSGN